MQNMLATNTTTSKKDHQTGFSDLPSDIIRSHVLTRLNGTSLNAAASTSSSLRHLSSDNNLWHNICHSTWPSTSSPRISHVISNFGPQAFFSQAFPILLSDHNINLSHTSPPSELISAVDIHYKGKLIFTKVQEMETDTDWFRCSPFRVDLLEPKDVVPTRMKLPENEESCMEVVKDMTMSWILIDSIGQRVANFSSHKPVKVERHWLTGEVHVQFASVLASKNGLVQCGMMVTCGGSESSGEMQVREVSMQMEDMDGMHLNGKDSLVILDVALRGKKGTGKYRVEEGERRFNEYVEMKRERRERKVRREGLLDVFCLAFGVTVFVSFCGFVWCKQTGVC